MNVSIRVFDTSGPSFILKNSMLVNFASVAGEKNREDFLDFLLTRMVNFLAHLK